MNVFDRIVSLNASWRDAVDILIVALIIYYILGLIRSTRAMQISIGLVILGSTTFVARAFDLPALEAISRQILFYLPFAVIVLFQQEIRRALASMVGNPLAVLLRPRPAQIPWHLIVDACEVLAPKRIGALIAIEGSQTLRMYEESAKPLDCIVSVEILVSIFMPGGPLHDGAAIVRGSRIASANAILPLTSSVEPAVPHGTRHRAALGLSEESDSLVVVVSEENGSIAIASEGVLHPNLDREEMYRIFREKFGAAQ